MQISTVSIGLMGVSAVVAIGLPIAIFIFLKVKYKAKFVPCAVGAAAFIVFALILEQLVHAVVLRQGSASYNFIMTRPLLYMLYGGLMAGIFEETARLLCFLLLKKRYAGVQNALSYGVGHGGIESILLVGVSMIASMVMAAMLNGGTFSALPGVTREMAEATVASLAATPPHYFLISGLERVFAICIQMCLSVLVYYAVMAKGEFWLYPVAIALHAVIDFPAALSQAGVITNIYLVEILVGVCAVLLVLFAMYVHKKLRGSVPVPEVAPAVSAAVPAAAAPASEQAAPEQPADGGNG